MNSAEQMEFPSLAFPKDRQLLYPHEIAERLRCSTNHIHDLIEEGKLRAISITGGGNISDRQCRRIPVEAWDKFVRDNTI